MKKTISVIIILISLILNIVFISAWAVHFIQSRFFTNVVKCNMNKPYPLYCSLGITDQQWSQLRPVLNRFSDSSKCINDSICVYRAKIIESLAEDSVDMELLSKTQDTIMLMQKNLQMIVVKQILSEKAILTPKQRLDLFLLLRGSCSMHKKGVTCDSVDRLNNRKYNCQEKSTF